eukprot:scaffold5004_cov110-Isochrysis_galbana.AAC.2
MVRISGPAINTSGSITGRPCRSWKACFHWCSVSKLASMSCSRAVLRKGMRGRLDCTRRNSTPPA